MRETITIHSAEKGWHRVELPDGEPRYVSHVYVSGVTVQLDHGMMELGVEKDEWEIDGTDKTAPCLFVESPSWYDRPERDTDA